jgi:hypothetical protein
MNELKQALLMAISALKQSKPSHRDVDDDYAEQGHQEHFASLAALQKELEKLGEEE